MQGKKTEAGRVGGETTSGREIANQERARENEGGEIGEFRMIAGNELISRDDQRRLLAAIQLLEPAQQRHFERRIVFQHFDGEPRGVSPGGYLSLVNTAWRRQEADAPRQRRRRARPESASSCPRPAPGTAAALLAQSKVDEVARAHA